MAKKKYTPTEHEILREGISIIINQIIKLDEKFDKHIKICDEENTPAKEAEEEEKADVPLPSSLQEAELVSKIQDKLYTNTLGQKVPLDDKLNHPMGKPDIVGVALTDKDSKSKK